MALPDSSTIVSSANGLAQAAQILWPVIISIITYIVAHTHTKKSYVKKDKPVAEVKKE